MTPTTPARSRIEPILDDLLRELKNFDGPVKDRGIRYFRLGRVGRLEFFPGQVRATVQGTRQYRALWMLANERRWVPMCSCPAAPRCKHAYALAEKMFEVLLDPEQMDPGELEDFLADGPVKAAPPAQGSVAPPRPRRDAPVRPTPVALPPPPPASLAELRRERSRDGRAAVLEFMLREAGITNVDVEHDAFVPILDAQGGDMQSWMLAQEILRWTHGDLPAELEPFRDRPDLAERHTEAQLPFVAAALRGWAMQRTSRPQRQFRVMVRVQASGRGELGFLLDPRLTTARLHEEPRSENQLRVLQSEVSRDVTLLTREQSDLLDGVIAMIESMRERAFSFSRRRSPRGLMTEFLLAVMPSPDVVWSNAIAEPLAAQLKVTRGEPLRFDPMPVRLTPHFVRDGEHAVVGIAVRWPDGRQRNLAECAHISDAASPHDPALGLLLCDGVLHPIAELPPANVLRLLRSTAPIRVDRKQGEPLVRTLADALPAAAQAAKAFTHEHAVEPAVMMRLDDEDWLQVRLMACTAGHSWEPGQPPEPPARLFEYTADRRWDVVAARGREAHAPMAIVVDEASSVDAIAARILPDDRPALTESRMLSGSIAPSAEPDMQAAEAWFHVPESQHVERVVEWIQQLGAAPGILLMQQNRGPGAPDARVGWWIKVTPRTVEQLAEVWRQRPTGVRWFGNENMDALIGSKRRVSASISAKRHGIDLFLVSAEWKAEGLSLTEYDIAQLRSSKQPWVKLGSGWVQREAIEQLDKVSDMLADLGLEPGGGEQQVTLWQVAQARPESLEALEEMGAGAETMAALRELRERVTKFKGLPHCKVPKGLAGELRPYQRQGLDFLAHASSLGMGALLADDMGLGKTIQALAWILHLRATSKAEGPMPALVVCPASVVHNWEREAAKFAPGLRVLALTSGGDRKTRLREIANYDLVITNYSLLRMDIEAWHDIPLFAAILDEAQTVKNPKAAVSHAVQRLQATHRLALTGTPIENRALDLWSIMGFVNPGYLGNRTDFSRRFDRIDAPAHTRRLLAARLRPMLLRRLKTEVAPELPERIEEQRMCEMLPAQRKLYLIKLAEAREEIASMALRGELKQQQIAILAILTRLRQICCHPQLAGAKSNVGSGKFDALFDLLEPLLAEGHKVLLFSQFVKALELVQKEFKRRRIPSHMLTGNDATKDRPAIVRAFENDTEACVFLISLKAGGTGLNLTAASYVVLLDPWWNPAVEAQAIDRTHRIGQHRTVIAYRLLMKGTIEERIWELQQRKSELVNSVLGGDGFARKLDRESLEYLFAEV